MKKLVVTAVFLFLIVGIAGPANAISWNWDLDVVNADALYGGNVITDSLHFDNSLGAATRGLSTVYQSFTGGVNDSILDDGDTFSEFGLLVQTEIDNSAVIYYQDGNITSQLSVYFSFSGFTGYIDNYDDGDDGPTTPLNAATNLQDDSFDLVFNTTGTETITMFLDETNEAGVYPQTTLADFSLVAAEGTFPELILGQSEGQFGIIAGFSSVLPNFWSFDDGTLFEDFMSIYGIPSVFMESANLGATYQTINGAIVNGEPVIDFGILNEGSFTMSVVPEPSTLFLLGIGLLGVAGIGRRRKK